MSPCSKSARRGRSRWRRGSPSNRRTGESRVSNSAATTQIKPFTGGLKTTIQAVTRRQLQELERHEEIDRDAHHDPISQVRDHRRLAATHQPADRPGFQPEQDEGIGMLPKAQSGGAGQQAGGKARARPVDDRNQQPQRTAPNEVHTGQHLRGQLVQRITGQTGDQRGQPTTEGGFHGTDWQGGGSQAIVNEPCGQRDGSCRRLALNAGMMPTGEAGAKPSKNFRYVGDAY